MQMAQRCWPENEKGKPREAEDTLTWQTGGGGDKAKTTGEECKSSWLANMKNAPRPFWNSWTYGPNTEREVSLGELFGPDQANLKP